MTTFHWHAHGVSALTFTNDGAYLLSGTGRVLVRREGKGLLDQEGA